MTMKNTKGIFTISLDFELHWGVMPRLSVEDYIENLEGTREGIEHTLQLFNKYNIHATWATVGFLFCEDKNHLINISPKLKPSYLNNKYNSYSILDIIGNSEKTSPFHFAKSVVDKIAEVPDQEIATHTFSHYFCLENGQTNEQFKADLLTAINIAKESGFDIKSIVFPRNQFNQEYLKTCDDLGIKNIRGNQKSKIYKPRKREEESAFVRIFRLLDSIINITGFNPSHVTKVNNLLNVPASRFLRPYNGKLSLLQKLFTNRIKNEMTNAAKKGLVYHLWWHPHNFGANVAKNLGILEDLLQHYSQLKKEYGFTSLNMQEIGELYSND